MWIRRILEKSVVLKLYLPCAQSLVQSINYLPTACHRLLIRKEWLLSGSFWRGESNAKPSTVVLGSPVGCFRWLPASFRPISVSLGCPGVSLGGPIAPRLEA